MAAAGAVGAVSAAAWPYTVDDAYIVGRYAWRWAHGLGWTFRDGPATDGVTGPLWVMPGALGELVGIDPVTLQKGLGAIAMAIAAAVAVRVLSSSAGGKRSAWIAVALLAVQGTLGVWGVAGLETGCATLLLTWAATTRHAPSLGVAAALLAATRPDTAPAILVLLIARRSGSATVMAIFGAAAVSLGRLAAFGHVLPLSFWAKGGTVINGLSYVAVGALLITGIGGSFLVAHAMRRLPRMRVLGVVVLVHTLTVALVGGDWMPGFRLLAPVLPLYAMIAARGTWHLSLRRRRWAALALVPALLLPAVDLGVQIGPVRQAGVSRQQAAPLVARLAELDSVALVDVGYLVYRSEADVLDLGGLTDPVIARAPGGHVAKEIPIAYLAEREPQVLLLHSIVEPEVDEQGRLLRLAGHPVERRIAASSWTRAHYRVSDVTRYAEGYWYVWLERL